MKAGKNFMNLYQLLRFVANNIKIRLFDSANVEIGLFNNKNDSRLYEYLNEMVFFITAGKIIDSDSLCLQITILK